MVDVLAEEYEELWNRAGTIANFFDGMEIADGKSLNGWRVEDETFADKRLKTY